MHVLYVTLIMFPAIISQQIFDKTYSSCSFTNEKDGKTISVTNKVWSIQGKYTNKRHEDTVIKFSLCELVHSYECDKEAAVCTINNEKSQFIIKNAGSTFVYTQDEHEKNIFKSINGQPCDAEENFTTIIELNSYPDLSFEPKFMYMSDCELKLEMIEPTFTPLCTLHEDGNFIDMRPLKAMGNFLITEPETRRNFSMSVCKHSEKCGDDVSACEIFDNGQTLSLSYVHTQHVVMENGLLSIQGHFGDSKQTRKNFMLTIKCNWNEPGISNLMYLKPMQQGKNFRFSAESSSACIKLPINCLVREFGRPNFLYDLRNLYKSNKGWQVGNFTKGIININMCGPLESVGECLEQHSQVCLTDQGSMNLGSIQKGFYVTSHDSVMTTFEDGGICMKNDTTKTITRYRTELEFVCKSVEEGPILYEIDNCIYRIKWHTPVACPKNMPVGEKCRISDLTGPIDLNNLHQSDKIHHLTPNSFLRYNLCGPLVNPCNNYTKASVCYTENGKEQVLGITNDSLIMANDIIQTTLQGERCNKDVSKTTIKYHCNHLTLSEGQVEVEIVRDYCEYEMNIHTSIACPPVSYFNCKIYVGNMMYNLSPLSRNTSNYEIQDGENLYSVNLCRSVVKTKNAQCSSLSSICMKNSTEPHAKHMYVSLGRITENIVPVSEKDDLIFDYKFGSRCYEDPNIFDMTSRLRLRCSHIDEEPMLFNKSPCYHEFIWRTPKACGTELSFHKTRSSSLCIYEHPVTNEFINLQETNFNINFNNSHFGTNITLNLCTSNYSYCTGINNTDCIVNKAEVSVHEPYVSYKMFNSCNINLPQLAIIHFICDFTEDVKLEVENTTDCTTYFLLKSKHICTEKELKLSYAALEDIITKQLSSKEQQTNAVGLEPQQIDIEQHKLKKKCIITELNNFTTDHFKNANVFSTLHTNYTFNFEGNQSVCNGFICRNNLSVFSKIETCPIIYTNFTMSLIQLLYESSSTCLDGYFTVEVRLKCKSGIEDPTLIQDTECKLVLEYPVEDVCLLFPPQKINIAAAASTGLVVGSSVGIIASLLIVTGGFVAFKKQYLCRRKLYKPVSADKENTFIYARNTSL